MPDRALRVALVIGEESGDQLGAGLIDAIRSRRPDTEFLGLAGERMTARGMGSLFPMADVAVMGIGSIIGHLPRIVRRGYQTVRAVVAADPDILVIIDSPGFTHAVAKRIARRSPSIPIIGYVSPQVWAWRLERVPRMVRYIDHVLALLPFEPELYQRLGGPRCTYVGHPLVEKLEKLRPAPGERGDVEAGPVLLVLPGSRRTEIERLMQPFGEAVERLIKSRPDLQVILPSVPHLEPEIRNRTARWQVQPEVVTGEAAKLAAFRRAHAALAASGTVTLELGLSGIPMVIAYRLDPITRLFKRLIKVPSIVLANLALGENVAPEFIDEGVTPEALAGAVLPLLSDSAARSRQLSGLSRLEALMRVPMPPSERAAEIVLDAANSGSARRGR